VITALLIALIALGLPTLYFASRSRDFRKFLAGAFFVSADSILSLSCQSVGAVTGHQSCRDTRNKWVALYRPFCFVWALPLLCFIQQSKASGE